MAAARPFGYKPFLPLLEGDAVIFELPHVTLILGGARSGKSRHAERLLTGNPPPWIYVATARALDDEMRRRVAEHQGRRKDGWRTIEAPIDVPGALGKAGALPVLVDCLTLWLTNLMLERRDVEASAAALLAALARRGAPTILVGAEVGLGVVPETPLGREFRDEAGKLHQRLAAQAAKVLLMVAGLPVTVK